MITSTADLDLHSYRIQPSNDRPTMSKGIDYSKWDHFDSSGADDDDVQQGPNSTTRRPPPTAEAFSKAYTQLLSSIYTYPEKVLATMDESTKRALCNTIKDNTGVNEFYAKLSASEMLDDAVAPIAIQTREAKTDRMAHLFNLTFKLRTGSEHAEEVLKQDGLNRIMSVMKEVRIQKYGEMDWSVWEIFESIPKDKLLTQEIRFDIGAMTLCISFLHEICRYRVGCVALANNSKCLEILLCEIPREFFSIVSKATLAIFLEDHERHFEHHWDLGSLEDFNVGMIEQGTIDTAGRLLNGLDHHPQLRNKIAAKLKRMMPPLEERVESFEGLLSKFGEWFPALTHCLDLSGSLKRLKKMVSLILDNPNSKSLKAWKSKFLIERILVDDPNQAEEEDNTIVEGTKTECHFCGKPPIKGTLKRCSQCKSVFYCSRDCQVKDWKEHKSDCVKHRGFVPSEMCSHAHFQKKMLSKLEQAGYTPGEKGAH